MTDAGLTEIFHFAEQADWDAAQLTGSYAPANYAQDGFIHAATAEQISGVVRRHLSGRENLLRLTIDPRALADTLRYDWSEASADLYPHVYAPIPLSAVRAVEHFDPASVL